MHYDKLRSNLMNKLRRLGITNESVLTAFSHVPREMFVPDNSKHEAYENVPLTIGTGQTISQPYTVARMMELLDPQQQDVILEIGTGSGYQAALLSKLVKSIYTVERIPALAKQAQNVFEKLNLDNIVSVIGDGTKGLPDYEPYDGIMVTAGAENIPTAYFDQLADGGRLVIPIGDRSVQRMVKVTRKDDDYQKEDFEYYMFVPLVEG